MPARMTAELTGSSAGLGLGRGRCHGLFLGEVRQHGVAEKARALGVAVRVGLGPGLGVVAQRVGDVELVAGARAGDVEQPAFLFDLVGAAGGHVGGDVAVGGVDDVHHVELEALGRVHGGEDQVVLVEQGGPASSWV